MAKTQTFSYITKVYYFVNIYKLFYKKLYFNFFGSIFGKVKKNRGPETGTTFLLKTLFCLVTT